MRACDVWMSRDFLIRRTAADGGEWLSTTTVRMPGGGLVELPAECEHPADDCPPHRVAVEPTCCGEPMVASTWTTSPPASGSCTSTGAAAR